MTVKYSICIANYNMSETLISSLTSILNQINDYFEVIVVDDGSDDDSVEKLLQLKNSYENLRVIPLIRDSRRKLGETRNISIRAARGKYVILHIDTDDIWDQYIQSFTKIYHEIEKRLKITDFMLSGKQIQMATKNLLIDNPYRNVYYVEDRLLWNELAVLGKLISIEHKPFFKRIPIKSSVKKLRKNIKVQCSSMTLVFLYSPSPVRNLNSYLKKIFFKSEWDFKLSALTLILLIPCFLSGYFSFKRKLISQFKGNCRDLTIIDLKELEKNSHNDFGFFELNDKERILFNM